MIEPFFFRDNKIFGCYHPASDANSSRLLVICPPLFDEYKRSYRALSELAIACADHGVHVLRFDYLGTGESFGKLENISITDWLNDIDEAIEEGIALTGADEIYLCGVRFGATLAAQSKHGKIKRYIFWDPVQNGKDYTAWLNKVNQEIKMSHLSIARYVNQTFENIEYVNFRLSQNLIEEMSSITLNQTKLVQTAEFFVITTNQSVFKSKLYANCEFPGLSYDWPAFHEGVIAQKPVLEAIARRVIEP